MHTMATPNTTGASRGASTSTAYWKDDRELVRLPFAPRTIFLNTIIINIGGCGTHGFLPARLAHGHTLNGTPAPRGLRIFKRSLRPVSRNLVARQPALHRR